MNINKQVTSLELSKELKNLGINQESLFYWHNLDSMPSIICSHWYPERSGDFFISAFTTAELFHLLPHCVSKKESETLDNFRLKIMKSYIVKNTDRIEPTEICIVNYRWDSINMQSKETILEAALGINLTKNIWDENSANAMAKMLIYLIENDFVKV